MEIDYTAIDRVLGTDVEERLAKVTLKEIDDLAVASGLLCMAFERWVADQTRSVAEHMTDLLDAYDAR